MAASIVVSQYVTLDGVIEDPVGMEGSGLGDWTGDYSRGPKGDAFKERELMEADAVLLGRRTYDGFAPVWPTVKSAYADKMNAMPKYLASTTVVTPEWTNTKTLQGNIATAVSELKQETNGTIIVFGSASLCHALFAAGLVDEVTMILYPVILGRGLKLFPEGMAAKFELAENARLGDGLMLLRYLVKR
ncbi:dihydrofolate reductase family protein [uncultured Nitratireductor sp.]|uniref:dihydrofolate reductase family protein n=1 Tax=uncultured Nitratireductor sp. TaxID=520953 RepID=UPI0025E5D44A|nr:dihydrofolate reductase family protein [uncultured Nitratireductor sp.]